MYFEEDYLYHIYNRSNNGALLFYTRDNYLFFLQKLRKHLKLYGSILAWCLMPSHFHIMIYINSLQPEGINIDLNSSIGKLLSSYTRALQKDQNIKGSLFQSHTKARYLNKIEEISPSYWQTELGAIINSNLDEYSYPKICFNYIHMNPVTDKLVRSPEEWEFSSYRDYFCERKGTLVDYDLARKEELIDFQLL